MHDSQGRVQDIHETALDALTMRAFVAATPEVERERLPGTVMAALLCCCRFHRAYFGRRSMQTNGRAERAIADGSVTPFSEGIDRMTNDEQHRRRRLSTEGCEPLELQFITTAVQGPGFRCALAAKPPIVQMGTNALSGPGARAPTSTQVDGRNRPLQPRFLCDERSTEGVNGMVTVERSVLRIDRPEVQQGMTPQHRVRPLMPAAMRGDFAATDPFLALMEDWFPRGVFGKHPHRGIETVTYVVAGRIDHYDNQGHEGKILPGDVQWMTAGRGLIHKEIPAEGVTVHSLQLWINLLAADKMTAPRYQDLAGDAVPVRRQPGVEVRVFSGASDGVTAPTKNFVPVTMLEIQLDRGVVARPHFSNARNGSSTALCSTRLTAIRRES